MKNLAKTQKRLQLGEPVVYNKNNHARPAKSPKSFLLLKPKHSNPASCPSSPLSSGSKQEILMPISPCSKKVNRRRPMSGIQTDNETEEILSVNIKTVKQNSTRTLVQKFQDNEDSNSENRA